MRDSDTKYTAFHAYCDGGFQQYQFRVMPFGIKPGSSIFQTPFQRVVQGLDFCKVYIDDGEGQRKWGQLNSTKLQPHHHLISQKRKDSGSSGDNSTQPSDKQSEGNRAADLQ